MVYVVFCFLFLVVSTSAIDCLERLVSKMTYYVLSGTLNRTHSVTLLHFCVVLSVACLSVCLYSYLAQILNETLRWAVVGPYAARVQDTDSVIAGHHVPAGVCYTSAHSVMYRHAGLVVLCKVLPMFC